MAAYLLSRLRAVAAAVVVVLAAGATVEAQDLEPRAYANTPVGLNFLLLGYGYQTGEVAFDPSAPIEDGELTAHGAFLAYARALNVWGRAGKLDVVLPYAWVSGTASVAGEPRDREVSGLADPRLRFSVLLYGAPALSLEEFADYTPGFIIGMFRVPGILKASEFKQAIADARKIAKEN